MFNTEKEFRDNLRKLIEKSDSRSITQTLSDLSFSASVHYLGEKEQLKALSKNKEEKFIKHVLSLLIEKYEIEKQIHDKIETSFLYRSNLYKLPITFKSASPEAVKSANENKVKSLEDFKNSVFIGLVGSIKSDDLKTLETLKLYWPNRKNVNQLAKKCGSLSLEKITDKLLYDMKSPPQDSEFKKININYYLKNVIKEADIDFLDSLWLKHKKDIKNVFQFLRDNDQFWLFEHPKDDERLDFLREYKTDKEIFNITNFSLEKIQWLDDKGIGLKQCGYKHLDLFLPLMDSQEINKYMEKDKIKIAALISSYAEERRSDFSWKRLTKDSASDQYITQHDKISKLVFHSSLSNKLPEKEKKSKAIKI